MKAIFSGTYCHNLDAKGRIIMPSRFREQLGESFMITQGYEHSLVVYTMEEWENFAASLSSMPEYNKDARRLIRIFASGATLCEPDKQGRFVLPANLRQYAGITKEVTIVGTLTKIEIWDSAEWEKYNTDEDSLSLEQAAENVSTYMGK